MSMSNTRDEGIVMLTIYYEHEAESNVMMLDKARKSCS